jgi:hypothetical protein
VEVEGAAGHSQGRRAVVQAVVQALLQMQGLMMGRS